MTDFNNRNLSSEIDSTDAGLRIDNWLTMRFTYHSRNQWQAMIKEKLITLNNQPTKSSRKLQKGDIVSFEITKEEPPVCFDYTVEYEDDTMMLINKCGNLPCHPAGPFYNNTLWHRLKLHFGETFMINRLDRETSGLLIVAKNKSAAAHLSKQVENHSIVKKYYAVVHGTVDHSIDANGFLTDDPHSEVRKKRRFIMNESASVYSDAETARTLITPLATGNNMTLVECTLETGRLHQIRATLYSLGFPLVGDKLYGVDDTMYLRLPGDQLTPLDREQLCIERQALHSYHLTLTHPVTGSAIKKEIPLPAELQTLLEKRSSLNYR